MKENKEWFESWFDSPYHALLYQHRDDVEAKKFIDKLFSFLQPAAAAKILDIACGDGRHAAYMSQFVQEVIGIDLSHNRIQRAMEHRKEGLHFYRHDMRRVFRSNYFDFAFNFFTSFGYFSQFRDNIIAAESFAKSLKPGGTLMIDYMNVHFVQQHLVAKETVRVDQIVFDIERSIVEGRILKQIRFTDRGGDAQQYEESVAILDINDFDRIFAQTGLERIAVFGDYNLHHFEPNSSPRLILLYKKPA